MKIKTKFRVLKKVYHVSDIQIRNVKRHTEYERVFDNLYKFIKQDTENAIIYIGGDIAHSKTDMSPELIDQLSRLFINLADLCPTFLIAGNHDCNLNNRSRLDVLTPIVNNIDHPDLYYLKDTGVYKCADTALAVLDVWDNEKNMPNPKKIDLPNKILFYHGTVDKAKTDLGFMLPSDVKIKDFNGYDMVMLGDIHKFQTMQEYKPGKITKPAVRYCGSLVQQNHGETLKGHGVSVWDVKNRTFIHQEIENIYGYYTMYITDGLVPMVDDLPEKARLRVRVKNTSPTDLKKALTVIRHRHNLKEVIIQNLDDFSVDGGKSVVHFGDISDPNVQSSLIRDYLQTKTTVSDEVLEQIKTINSELSSMIVEESVQRNVNWKLKKFEFSNMFSYGEDNSVDFTRMNGIVGLFAANASGKSSLLDALTFCLFDKSTRAWRAENVMNHAKDEFSCKVEFEIGQDTYFIERFGHVTRRGATRVDVDFYRIDENGTKESLNGDQRASTNKNIRNIIGTYEDFVLTSFSSQTNSAVFLDHNQTERKDILSKFLGLSVFDQLYELAKRDSSGLQSMLKNFLDVDYDTQISDIENGLKKQITQAEDLRLNLESSELELKNIEDEIYALMKSMKPVDSDVGDIDALNLNLGNTEKQIDELKETKESLEDELKSVKEDSALLEHRIRSDKFSNIDKKVVDFNFLLDKRNKTKTEIDLLKAEVKSKLDKIERLGNLQYDPNCDYCVNNVFVKDAINTKEELELDKDRAGKLVGLLKTVDNQILIDDDIPGIGKEHKSLALELTENSDHVRRIAVEIKAVQSDLDRKENDILVTTQNITKSKRYQSDIKFNGKVQAELGLKNTEKDTLGLQLKNMNTDLQNIMGKQVSLETRKSEIMTTIAKVRELEKKYDAYKYYLMAVGKDGVSYDLISKILSTVEVEVNDILAQVVDFTILFEMDGKNVNNYICYGDDKQWPLELASGMERFISSLAIRIALTNVSNLPRPNFIAIDEGWGTMDSDNINSVYKLFEYLKNQYQFSLIISHIDAMRDFTDDLLEIRREENNSKLNF
jgi:DNA repair exonuclease SbcCD ATPase subunit